MKNGARSADSLLRSVEAKMKEVGAAPGPKLAPAAIASFERHCGIELPEDYARFLREVGNGATSADGTYDLWPLGTVPPAFHDDRRAYLDGLKRPFPFIEGAAPSDDMWDGCLGIGGDGFYVWCLVVTGEQRGTIWELSPDGVVPNSPPRGFLAWYDFWLDGGPDDWCELDDADAPSKRPAEIADPLDAQRDAVRTAMLLAGHNPELALQALDEVVAPSLQGPCIFVRALVSAVKNAPDAEVMALDAAESWLGPAVEGAVNQGVTREEMLELLHRFTSPAATAVAQRVHTAPDPDVYIPDGDFF